MKRLELKRIRICQRCGRARAELETPDGDALSVPLDGVRARELSGDERDVRWVADLVLAQLRAAGTPPAEVVLDAGPGGLRALLSVLRGDEADVIGCTAQEGLSLAVRGNLRLYATPEALAGDTASSQGERDPGSTVH